MLNTVQQKVNSNLAKRAKALNLDAIHDTVHEMARDEARHGKHSKVCLRDTSANRKAA